MFRRRSGCRVRPCSRAARLQLGQRRPAVLLQPGLELPGGRQLKGFEAIAVSRMDSPTRASILDKNSWMRPVVISRQSNATFSNKSQVWADNAASSPFFGNVYVCWAMFQGQEKGNAAPAALQVAVSRDGGATWTQHQISAAANNGQRNPPDGCTIRTDSLGNAYVFGVGTVQSAGGQSFELMSVSRNPAVGTWSAQRRSPARASAGDHRPLSGPPHHRRGHGARSDLAPAPASTSPTTAGSGATNHMVISFVSGRARPATRNPTSTSPSRAIRASAGRLPADRDPRGPRLLRRARHLARRQHGLRRVQRLHHAIPDHDERPATPGGRGLAGNGEFRCDRGVVDPQPRRHR